MVRTPLVIVRGERVDQCRLRAARRGFERLMTKPSEFHVLLAMTEGVVGDGQVGDRPSDQLKTRAAFSLDRNDERAISAVISCWGRLFTRRAVA